MLFILRAIFWLAVVSAFLPERGADEAAIAEVAGRGISAAVDFCTANPPTCANTAKASAEVLSIPAGLFENARYAVAHVPPPVKRVPEPMPRPAF